MAYIDTCVGTFTMRIFGVCCEHAQFLQHTAPPPSYNDVVGTVPPAGSGEPSAPPLGVVTPDSPGAITPLMAHHTQAGYDAGESLRRQGEEGGGEGVGRESRKRERVGA